VSILRAKDCKLSKRFSLARGGKGNEITMSSVNRLSLTPRFNGVKTANTDRNGFSGFPCVVETAQAVLRFCGTKLTLLKRGVNEIAISLAGSLPM
jgi:hypothetical protein